MGPTHVVAFIWAELLILLIVGVVVYALGLAHGQIEENRRQQGGDMGARQQLRPDYPRPQSESTPADRPPVGQQEEK